MEIKSKENNNFTNFANIYLKNLNNVFDENILERIQDLSRELKSCWVNSKNVFICGNGGSAGNAMHIANDFHYGIGYSKSDTGKKSTIPGLRMIALPSNPSIITCLGNDIGYENIYSHQLEVLGNAGDILIILSGSGNSQNVINAILTAKKIGIKTYAIVGFDGGKCKEIADKNIHFKIKDMQIAEDTQLILFHICMQWISKTRA
ncbi:SIS domain-containing protein [Prochlorococcus marinus]|uniref:Putative phosphoheptose isomerase n=1 Tax=Prochlorococcus marinus (strain AS9601) TaxID=146891 RepID=A2BSG3_PROMS|nr:SIS domain-containing protein [Prochlorococcus marinus]ABM70724.1 putative phosphoheptose isomerase [Prochlorococcus marinus str. AS9601]